MQETQEEGKWEPQDGGAQTPTDMCLSASVPQCLQRAMARAPHDVWCVGGQREPPAPLHVAPTATKTMPPTPCHQAMQSHSSSKRRCAQYGTFFVQLAPWSSPQLVFSAPFHSLMWSTMTLAAWSGECCRPRASTKSPSGSIR